MLFYFISLENRYNFLFIFGQLGRIRKIYYDVITKIFYTSDLFIISILRSNIFAFQSSEDNASLLCRVLQSCLSIIYYQWMHHDLVLEKILESTLDYREIQPVHRKGNQSWIFIGRTGAEAETPRLWPTDGKNWPIGKDPDTRKDWKQEEKGTTLLCHSPSPQNWENKTSTAMQKHKGVLLPARARAPISSSTVESWWEPGAQIYSSIYKFRTKTGSWQGLIGRRGFLVFTDWPELSSLWLARVTIPGSPGSMTQGLFLA